MKQINILLMMLISCSSGGLSAMSDADVLKQYWGRDLGVITVFDAIGLRNELVHDLDDLAALAKEIAPDVVENAEYLRNTISDMKGSADFEEKAANIIRVMQGHSNKVRNYIDRECLINCSLIQRMPFLGILRSDLLQGIRSRGAIDRNSLKQLSATVGGYRLYARTLNDAFHYALLHEWFTSADSVNKVPESVRQTVKHKIDLLQKAETVDAVKNAIFDLENVLCESKNNVSIVVPQDKDVNAVCARVNAINTLSHIREKLVDEARGAVGMLGEAERCKDERPLFFVALFDRFRSGAELLHKIAVEEAQLFATMQSYIKQLEAQSRADIAVVLADQLNGFLKDDDKPADLKPKIEQKLKEIEDWAREEGITLKKPVALSVPDQPKTPITQSANNGIIGQAKSVLSKAKSHWYITVPVVVLTSFGVYKTWQWWSADQEEESEINARTH